MKDIEKFHQDLGKLIDENYLLKREIRELKYTVVQMLLHKKNRGRITGMMTMGLAYIDFNKIEVDSQRRFCRIRDKTSRKIITNWDEVPRTENGKDEKPSR